RHPPARRGRQQPPRAGRGLMPRSSQLRTRLLDRLFRHLIAARRAAAHKDLLNLVTHADQAFGVVEQLRQQRLQEVDARLDLVVAAVELGVEAARRRNWKLAYDTLDLIHSLV